MIVVCVGPTESSTSSAHTLRLISGCPYPFGEQAATRRDSELSYSSWEETDNQIQVTVTALTIAVHLISMTRGGGGGGGMMITGMMTRRMDRLRLRGRHPRSPLPATGTEAGARPRARRIRLRAAQ
eukprot:3105074-Rhodomonas_salina.2